MGDHFQETRARKTRAVRSCTDALDAALARVSIYTRNCAGVEGFEVIGWAIAAEMAALVAAVNSLPVLLAAVLPRDETLAQITERHLENIQWCLERGYKPFFQEELWRIDFLVPGDAGQWTGVTLAGVCRMAKEAEAKRDAAT